MALFSVYDDNIFLCFFFFREFNVFSIENFKFYFKSWTLQRMPRMTKHVSKAGKVDQGDKVTLPVKFADKPGLSLTRLPGWPQNKGNPLGLSLPGAILWSNGYI